MSGGPPDGRAVSLASCAMCGKSMHESKLLFSDAGRVCGSCELELGDREVESNHRWTAAVAGPLLAFTAFIFLLAGFVPVIGLVTASIAPLLAIVAVAMGVRAFLEAGEADGPIRTLMVLSGAVSIPSGLVLVALSVLIVLTQLLVLAGLR